jgi:hypothetical protein
MSGWDAWKKGFDAWEDATARHLEAWMRSPLVLRPGAEALSAAMRAKRAVDGALGGAWSALGLPTRREQERAQHSLNELQSRLMDLEETLAEMRAEQQTSRKG